MVLAEGLPLDCGERLAPITVAYEQYGRPNADRSNVILVCHALSGGAHAAGYDAASDRAGWWDALIGEGRAFDTTRFCVLCSNVLGGCYGTTGPSSIDPRTGAPFGPDFPVVTIRDMVRVQAALLDALGIEQVAAVVGGSMGGMQALAWPTLFPHRVRSVVAIATTDRHSPRQIALNEVARQAVLADPAWNGGRYLPGSGPSHGLAVARMLGHVTYLSDESMDRKFGRRLRDGRRRFEIGPQFEVEHYLRHQGDRFVERFDANALLYITHAIDHFDMSEGFADLERAAAATRARFLLLAFSSDWLYPPSDLARIAARLEASGKSVMYRCIEDDRGHDAFLLNDDEQARLIGRFLGGAGALRAI